MSKVVEHLISNRDHFFKYAKAVTKRPEVAEDIIQSSALRFLVSKIEVDEIKDVDRFIKSTIRQVYLNYITVNKKYAYASMVRDESGEWTEVEFEDPEVIVFNIDEHSMKMIIKKTRAAGILSNKEIAAVERYLRNEGVDSKTAEYETLKTHKRNAIIKMKNKFAAKQGEKRD